MSDTENFSGLNHHKIFCERGTEDYVDTKKIHFCVCQENWDIQVHIFQ